VFFIVELKETIIMFIIFFIFMNNEVFIKYEIIIFVKNVNFSTHTYTCN